MQEVQPADVQGIPRVQLPQKLGVVVPPGHDIEPVWHLLVAAGLSPEADAGRAPVLVNTGKQGFEALPAWLEQHPEGHILLLFNAPVPMIAGLMADALEPGEAVAQWRRQAEQVLAVVRQNRRCITLVALEAALADPAAFINLLGERFGLALKRPVDSTETDENPGAVFRMMAENAVWQSPDVRNLAAELEANALPMPPSRGLLLPAVEEVYSEFNALVERTSSRNKELEEENELLLQQLHQVQEELETTLEKNRNLSTKLDALEKEQSAAASCSEQLTKVQTELDQVKRQSDERRKDLEEENELLLHQLHHVQEELESYYLNGMNARHELEEVRATIEALYNSMSWKITRPLRFLVDLFTGHRGETR